MQPTVSFIQVIRNRGFLNLWINQILVQLSYNSLNFALIIWVFGLTNSNTAVSALLFAVYLPAVIFGLFSGILIDLTDRKKIIMAINILLAIFFISLIFLKESYVAILVIAFLINILGQFYAPAEASAIPLIVKPKELLSANSLFTTTLFSSFLIGFGLSGVLINHFGIDFVFGMGGGLLILAFLLALRFPSIVNIASKEGRQLVGALRALDYQLIEKIIYLEIKNTIEIIRGKFPVLFSIMILAGVQVVIGVLAVLIPSFLERDIQIKATDAAYVLVIPLGVGMVLGGYLIGKIGLKIPKRTIVSLGVMVAGLLFLLVGIAPFASPVIEYFPKPRPLPFFYQPPLSGILAVGSFLLGAAMVSIIIPSQTVLQQNTPEQLRGKVFSVLAVVMQGLSLVPVFFAGVLADLFGTLPLLLILGAVTVLIGLFALRPNFYFEEKHLPFKLREFLGLGHWEKE